MDASLAATPPVPANQVRRDAAFIERTTNSLPAGADGAADLDHMHAVRGDDRPTVGCKGLRPDPGLWTRMRDGKETPWRFRYRTGGSSQVQPSFEASWDPALRPSARSIISSLVA